ncbi:MAG TPA: DUF3108 domain-containing protein [Xanthobacteraceae bacterium]|nr:DUF3108 domain-containing protein [Xanthobacteraceae bacterium]
MAGLAAIFASVGLLVGADAHAGDPVHQTAAVQAAKEAATAAAKSSAGEGRLEAEYQVTLGGIPIGHGNWVVEIADDGYTAAASGTTTGIIRFFTGARGTGNAHGAVTSGQMIPASYDATISYGTKVDDVRMTLAGGNVTDYAAEPPLPPVPDRIPVSDTDRHGVSDPMSSMLNRVSGNGDPVTPEACNRKVAVFDGRVRYDLHSEFKRVETVKADRGYAGPVLVCAVYFTPISGYVPSRPAIKYLVELREAEVWLAPISGTHVLVPFRFSMPTPLGTGLLQATAFVTVTQASHPAAKTQ